MWSICLKFYVQQSFVKCFVCNFGMCWKLVRKEVGLEFGMDTSLESSWTVDQLCCPIGSVHFWSILPWWTLKKILCSFFLCYSVLVNCFGLLKVLHKFTLLLLLLLQFMPCTLTFSPSDVQVQVSEFSRQNADLILYLPSPLGRWGGGGATL